MNGPFTLDKTNLMGVCAGTASSRDGAETLIRILPAPPPSRRPA
ncbi:MAG TPA: hypothetical protein VF727_03180 [Allosphingosinicella sp.]|jgi:hypothetical protein